MSRFLLVVVSYKLNIVCLQVEDLERKCRQQQEQIYDLKEQVTHLQSELTMKGSQYEGQ